MSSPWRDDFDNPELAPQWFWVNENLTMWSLTDQPGFLRIDTSALPTGGQNMPLISTGKGDFRIETHVLLQPTANFQFAGLAIYQDQGNFVQLGRAFCDVEGVCVGNGIYFDLVQGGSFQGSNFATQTAALDDAYVRLERRGRNLKAYYSEDGVAWDLIGTHRLPPSFSISGCGLTSSQDYAALAIPADFDYFIHTQLSPPSASP
jgi:beta-xylosidase